MTTFWSALVNGAILSAPLAFAVWFVLRLAPRRTLNAATRYAIWWMVLLATLALPLSSVEWRVARHAAASSPARPTSARDLPWERSAVPDRAPVSRGITLPVEIPASQWLWPILAAWIAVSLALLARVFVSYAALYRLSARAAAAAPELSERITGTVRRAVRLAVSDEIAIPMATGPLRPAVLMPETLVTRMSAGDLEQVGRHEAAHLARYDDYALMAQRVIEALLALHPVVRWLTRQIDLEREIACDDIAAGPTEHARSYADCLTRTVVLCGGVCASLAAANAADGRSHFSRRIELLADRSRNVRTGLIGSRFAAIAVPLICLAGLLAKTPLLVAFGVPRIAAPAPGPAPIDTPMKAPFLRAPEHLFIAQAQKPAVPQPNSPPTTFEQQRQTGMEQMRAGKFDAAIATFQSLISEAPSDHATASLWSGIGDAYRNLGNLDKTIEAMQQVILLLPNSPNPLVQIALLYDAKGDAVHARQYYEKAIAMDPNNPLVLNNLAYMLAETGGDLDQALNYARTAQEKMPNFLEVDDTVGWIYLKKNMPAIAVAEFRKLIDARPDNPGFRYHYALALYQEENLPDALTECQTALANKPSAGLERQIRDLIDKIAPMSDSPRGIPLILAPPK